MTAPGVEDADTQARQQLPPVEDEEYLRASADATSEGWPVFEAA